MERMTIMYQWIVSDWHFGETRLDVMGRPFPDSDSMNKAIISNHNALVKPSDNVLVLGDICKDPLCLPLIGQLNGNKTLVRGNHDRKFTNNDLFPYFGFIVGEGYGLELDCDGVPCYATHYPTQGKQDRFNLVGHIHSAWKYQLNMLNCCVDVHHFKPVSVSKIPFHLKAISEYYDEDVWVAYDTVNSKYRGVRGKPGSYFPERE